MPTLWFIPGVGVSSSSASGLPLVCRVRKPLPCALRSSATPALAGDAPLLQHHPQGLGLCLCLRLQWKQLILVYFFVPSACACLSEVTVTSYSHLPSVSLRGIVTQSNVLSCMRAWPGLVWVYPCTRSVDTTEKQTSNVVCGFDQARSKMARFACPDKSKDRIRAKCLTCLSVLTHPKTRIGLIQTANAAPHSAADAPPPPSTSPTPGYHLVLRLR